MTGYVQILFLALMLTLVVKLAAALHRKPWFWALLMLFLTLFSEWVCRNFLPGIVATLVGVSATFLLLYLVKFTRFRI